MKRPLTEILYGHPFSLVLPRGCLRCFRDLLLCALEDRAQGFCINISPAEILNKDLSDSQRDLAKRSLEIHDTDVW